ncbi:hypothetical protein [Methylosinus sporium]|uniref:hypothetical protein n=1 Tax=Methylosinus sporium TaxID=428 RepID=UPI00383B0985
MLIKQGRSIYRLMRIETSSDGSLQVFSDRDPRPNKIQRMEGEGVFVLDHDSHGAPLPSARFSIHTTGQVHRYHGGRRLQTIFIEPLPCLTAVTPIGFMSVPSPTRLDVLDTEKHTHNAYALFEIPEGFVQRLTFQIEVGPKPQTPPSDGVTFNYEIYAVTIRLVPHALHITNELTDHFIYGMPERGLFAERQAEKSEAELAFYRNAIGELPIIMREDSGSYVLFAQVPMRIAPKPIVEFDRDDLKIELIPFQSLTQPSHKLRFWICDIGGRNKVDDLRKHIRRFTLDAEL